MTTRIIASTTLLLLTAGGHVSAAPVDVSAKRDITAAYANQAKAFANRDLHGSIAVFDSNWSATAKKGVDNLYSSQADWMTSFIDLFEWGGPVDERTDVHTMRRAGNQIAVDISQGYRAGALHPYGTYVGKEILEDRVDYWKHGIHGWTIVRSRVNRHDMERPEQEADDTKEAAWEKARGYRKISTRSGAVTHIIVSPDSQLIAYSSSDGMSLHSTETVTIVEAATLNQVTELSMGDNMVKDMAFSPDSSLLAVDVVTAVNNDNASTIAVYDRMSWNRKAVYTYKGHPIDSIGWLDAETILFCPEDKNVEKWAVAEAVPTQFGDYGFGPYPGQIALSPDGKWLAGSGIANGVAIFDSSTGNRANITLDNLWWFAWSPSGNRLAATPLNETSEITIVTDPNVPTRSASSVKYYCQNLEPIGWMPDGKSIVCQTEHDVLLVDMSGKASPLVSELQVLAAAASPNGKFVAFSENDSVSKSCVFMKEVR